MTLTLHPISDYTVFILYLRHGHFEKRAQWSHPIYFIFKRMQTAALKLQYTTESHNRRIQGEVANAIYMLSKR